MIKVQCKIREHECDSKECSLNELSNSEGFITVISLDGLILSKDIEEYLFNMQIEFGADIQVWVRKIDMYNFKIINE